jgi:hypothetical protein
MRIGSVTIAFVSALCLFASIDGQQPRNKTQPTSVSLIRLIANPQSLDGQRVRIAGYLDYNGLDRAVGVYISESDGRNFIISNSIDLHHADGTDFKSVLHSYVIMNATYYAPKGALAEYRNGYLDHISDIMLLNQGDLPK